MKLLSTSFRATLEKFGIKGLTLSEESGVSTGAISNFRNDVAGITTESLERLLSAFSDEALAYWTSQILAARSAEKNLSHNPLAIQTFVNAMDGETAADFLACLAIRVRAESKKANGQIALTNVA